MSKKSKFSDKPSVSIGAKIELNADTPIGLFQGPGVNRYVVVDNGGWKSAIVLCHSQLPIFSWTDLNERTFDKGRWLGPWRLRLNSALENDEEGDPPEADEPGILGIGDGCAILHCRSHKGHLRWLPLGFVGDDGYETYDYDGWALEVLETHRTFFEKWPTSLIPQRYLTAVVEAA